MQLHKWDDHLHYAAGERAAAHLAKDEQTWAYFNPNVLSVSISHNNEQGDKTALARPPWNAFCVIEGKMVSAGCRVRMEAAVENLSTTDSSTISLNADVMKGRTKQSGRRSWSIFLLVWKKRNFTCTVLRRFTKTGHNLSSCTDEM